MCRPCVAVTHRNARVRASPSRPLHSSCTRTYQLPHGLQIACAVLRPRGHLDAVPNLGATVVREAVVLQPFPVSVPHVHQVLCGVRSMP